MNINNLSLTQLKKAVALKEQISELEGELAALLGTTLEAGPVAAPAVSLGRKKGQMSAAGRARIIAAQKARWAKVKALKVASAPAAKPMASARKKPMISAAGIARIKAAQKLRWAKAKAGKGAAPAATAKPTKKWKLSAAGLAKIKAANKAYWAKKKAGKL
jgi:hypothetical protein